jgi:hypothetical protein
VRGTRAVDTLHDEHGRLTAQGRKIVANNLKLAEHQGRIAKHEFEVWARSFGRNYEETLAALVALPVRRFSEDQLYRSYASHDSALRSRL